MLVERKLWQGSPRRSRPAGLWAATDRENAFARTQISPTGQAGLSLNKRSKGPEDVNHAQRNEGVREEFGDF